MAAPAGGPLARQRRRRRLPGSLTALRVPRRTVRLRLTLLYGGLFLLSGAGLLLITYLLVANRMPVLITRRGGAPSGGATALHNVCFSNTGGSLPSLGQVTQCEAFIEAQASAQHNAVLSQLLTESGIALAIMAVASIGLGWLVAGRVLRPLRTITATARRLSASNLHERLALAGPDDELKELGDTFDALLARLEGAFAAQRQFVANASHELRTPLARQRTMVEVALADPAPRMEGLLATCERVLAAAGEQERLIEALLTLASSQRGLDRLTPVDLAAVAATVAASFHESADRRQISVSAALDPAPVMGDPGLLERLVTNLLDNALRHNSGGGWAAVATGTRAGWATLSVTNSGRAIPPAEVSRLFEPFQRLAAQRTGRESPGLGLSIVSAITQAHSGWLRARARPEGGLEVLIRIPAAPAAPSPPGPAQDHGIGAHPVTPGP